jgi:hypothetical protein
MSTHGKLPKHAESDDFLPRCGDCREAAGLLASENPEGEVQWMAKFEELETAYKALPDLTDAEIAELPDDVLTDQAWIEMQYLSALMVRSGHPDMTVQALVMDHPGMFDPKTVDAARDQLAELINEEAERRADR